MAIGRHLQDVGELEDSDFDDLMRHLLNADLCGRISSLEKLMETRSDLPSEWHSDAGSYAHNLSQMLHSGSNALPTDWVEGRTIEEARRLTKETFRAFGDLMYWWPAIMDAVKELRQRGGGRVTRCICSD